MSTRLNHLEAENEGMRLRLQSPSPGPAPSGASVGTTTPTTAGAGGTPPLTPNTAFKNNSIAVALEERESYEASLREMSLRVRQLQEENEFVRGLDWRKRDAVIVDLSERLTAKEAWCADARRGMAAMRAALADAKSDDNKFATDNAVDAIGRICKFRSSLVNTAEILPVWISWLPLQDDDDCARHCHAFLADLIEAKHPAVQQQLPTIMAALPAVLTPDCKLATQEVQQRIRQGLAQGYGQTV